MKVLVIGATGFIGHHLVRKLIEREHEVIVFTRNHVKAQKLFVDRVYIQQWRTDDYIMLQEFAHKVEVVINLAGENLAAKRWTSEQKRKILSTRVNIGKALSFALKQSHTKPYLLMQASAVDYYGFSEDKVFTEEHSNGSGFLAMVTRQWEDSVRNVEKDKTRKVFLRTGVVLGRQGGMLPKVMLPFRYFAGAYLGSGEQSLSWIHIEDEVDAIIWIMEKKDSAGAYNLTSPNPVSMKEFVKTLSKVMGRPAFFKVPSFVLKTIYGDMAKETILSGQKAIPKRLQNEGFEFKHTDLEEAIKNILNK
ncbi:MAG: TIGR01777 family oxidoreductase [Bacteroidales bacterium]